MDDGVMIKFGRLAGCLCSFLSTTFCFYAGGVETLGEVAKFEVQGVADSPDIDIGMFKITFRIWQLLRQLSPYYAAVVVQHQFPQLN